MDLPKGDTFYMLNGKIVARGQFLQAAGKCGLLEFDGACWETFYEQNGTMRQCVTGEYMFTTIRVGKPCLN